MTASQIAELEAMTDAEVLALAYAESAAGNLGTALCNAAEDILTLEAKLEATSRLISHGFARSALAQSRD